MADLAPVPVRLVAPGWERRVPAPAHDALDPAARRRYLDEHPDSYLTVTRSPDDLEPGEVWNADEALAASRAALQGLLDRQAFTAPRAPALYLYRLTEGGHRQLGIVGGVSVDDYDDGAVRIHERVKPERAGHLADQLGELRVQSSPITLAHRPCGQVTDTIATVAEVEAPILDVTSADGLQQEVWRVDDPDVISRIRSTLVDETFYLIDGHHRAAAASTYRAARDAGHVRSPHLMLCAVFPTDELKIEAFHRWLPRVDPGWLLAELRAVTAVRIADGVDAVLHRDDDELALWAAGGWHLVTAPPAADGPIDGLDTVRLDRRILAPLIGIDQSNPGDDLAHLHGMADRADLQRVESVPTGVVWAMRPVRMDALLAVSDAGLTMPPKSTYFVPKVRSGVFLRSLDGT